MANPTTVSTSSSTQPRISTNHRKQTKKPLFIALLAFVLLLAGIFAYQYVSNQIMPNRYQAVFLNNGQVYFGKLHDYYGTRPYMTDVYYFQASGQTGSNAAAQSDQLLVKMGQEIHAPENKLILNKDAILFVENLTDGGKVTEAINKNAANGATTQPTGGITR
jgi:hypothetical protein